MKYSLNELYEVVGLSKQAVSQYFKKQYQFEQDLSALLLQVDELRAEHPGCGVEKMYYILQPSFLGRDRFIDVLMQMGYGVVKVKNFVKTTKPVHSEYKNLITGMLLSKINQVLQSDITYFLASDRYYYIVFIMDVFSKRILGFEASDHLRAQANIKAFRQVIRLRGKKNLNNMIHHSDRGSQYVSTKYRELLRGTGVHISMGDSAMENAYAERINGIIKNEYLQYWGIKDLGTLRKALKKAVKNYNHKRIHKHLPNRMTPVGFEKAVLNNTLSKPHRELIYAQQNTIKRNQLNLLLSQSKAMNNQYCPLFS